MIHVKMLTVIKQPLLTLQPRMNADNHLLGIQFLCNRSRHQIHRGITRQSQKQIAIPDASFNQKTRHGSATSQNPTINMLFQFSGNLRIPLKNHNTMGLQRKRQCQMATNLTCSNDNDIHSFSLLAEPACGTLLKKCNRESIHFFQ